MSPLCIDTGDLDWEAVEAVLQYGLQSCLRFDPSLIPTMLGDSMFETRADKEKVFSPLHRTIVVCVPHLTLYPSHILADGDLLRVSVHPRLLPGSKRHAKCFLDWSPH